MTFRSFYDILIANDRQFSVTDGISVEHHEEAENLIIADRLGTLDSLWVKCVFLCFLILCLEVCYEKSWNRDGERQ